MSSFLKSDSQQDISFKSAQSINLPSELHWYVLYTRSRAEEKVQKELSLRNYHVYLPLTRKLKVWRNRQKKLISHILFPNYIFIKTTCCKLNSIIQLPDIVSFINCSGEPSVVPDKEIDAIRNMIDYNIDISIEPVFKTGERVKIVDGPLSGYEGILVEQKGKNRFGIHLEVLNKTILADICLAELEKY